MGNTMNESNRRVVCHQREDDGEEPRWRRVEQPNCIRILDGITLLDLPSAVAGAVNGVLAPGGYQVLERDDLIRVKHPEDGDTLYLLGDVLPALEPGRGRMDDFSASPIEGEAVRCPGCEALFAVSTAVAIGNECPRCRAPLGTAEQSPEPPWEDL